VVLGKRVLESGDLPIVIPRRGSVSVFLTSEPSKHVGISFLFDDLNAPITMAVSRCEGPQNVQLGQDTSRVGRRMLSIFDSGPSLQYVIELSTSGESVQGSLQIVRTTFRDGEKCTDDCDRLLQFPLPNDVNVDGYHMAKHALFRYQFGRRDVLMLARHTFRSMRAADYGPAIVLDLSQWDGKTPGIDVGKPRHHSHKRGIDIDVSLYDNAAVARLRAFCDTKPASFRGKNFEHVYFANGEALSTTAHLVCQTGRVHDFNAYAVTKCWGSCFRQVLSRSASWINS
jgi:hypothetical protein